LLEVLALNPNEIVSYTSGGTESDKYSYYKRPHFFLEKDGNPIHATTGPLEHAVRLRPMSNLETMGF